MFSVRTTSQKLENATITVDNRFVLEENWGMLGNHYRDVIGFHFSFFLWAKTQSRYFQTSPV